MTAMPQNSDRPLIESLPKLRGRLEAEAPLAPLTWFRVGGPAEVFARPDDLDDLRRLLSGLRDLGVEEIGRPTILGGGSNLLVRDGGLLGVTLRLGRGFTGIDTALDGLVVGAACLDGTVAAAARRAGLAGLEFLSGVPGTIGGAIRMNAGAYGRELSEVLVWAEAIDAQGRLVRVTAEELGFSYRHSEAPEDWIFLRAALRGTPGDPKAIAERLAKIKAERDLTQPIRQRTGGSTFKNPDPALSGGRKAWELIDAAGCRGLWRGAAQVSEKHCNFLINHGGAKAADLEALGEEVRARVLETSGVALAWEIIRLGEEVRP